MEPDVYPIVKLDVCGFQHRDERVGWVKTPIFPRIGKAPKSDVSAAVTSVADDLTTPSHGDGPLPRAQMPASFSI